MFSLRVANRGTAWFSVKIGTLVAKNLNEDRIEKPEFVRCHCIPNCPEFSSVGDRKNVRNRTFWND